MLVAAVLVVDTAFYAAIAPLLPQYVDELGISQTAAGVLTASYAAGTLIASLPGGWLATRLGVKPTLLTGLTLLGVSTLVFGHSSDIAVLDLARFVQGVGGALTWAAGFAWLVRMAPPDRRGEFIGGALSAAVFGVMLGPVVGVAAAQISPEVVFSGVAVLAAGLGAWALGTPSPELGDERTTGYAQGLLNRRIATGVWLVALPALIAGAVEVLAPLRLSDLGAGSAVVGGVFLVSAGVEAAITPFLGRLSDRRGRMAPIRIGLTASIPVAVILSLVGTVALVSAGVIAMFLALSFFWAPGHAMLSDSAEELGMDQGRAGGFMNLAWAGGMVAGGVIGGAFADSLSDAAAYGLVASLCALSLVVLLTRPREPLSAR